MTTARQLDARCLLLVLVWTRHADTPIQWQLVRYISIIDRRRQLGGRHRVHERAVASTGAMHLRGALHLTIVWLPRMQVSTGQRTDANSLQPVTSSATSRCRSRSHAVDWDVMIKCCFFLRGNVGVGGLSCAGCVSRETVDIAGSVSRMSLRRFHVKHSRQHVSVLRSSAHSLASDGQG